MVLRDLFIVFSNSFKDNSLIPEKLLLISLIKNVLTILIQNISLLMNLKGILPRQIYILLGVIRYGTPFTMPEKILHFIWILYPRGKNEYPMQQVLLFLK